MLETAKAVREQLWLNTAVEGCARYQGDVYQRAEDCPKDIPGNPWFISTLWLAEYFIDQAENQQQLQATLPYLEWCGNNALPSGVPCRAGPSYKRFTALCFAAHVESFRICVDCAAIR